MKTFKFFILLFVFLRSSLLVHGQTIKQFNGQFSISYINSTGDSNYDINGTFSDQTYTFNPNQVAVGDRIIDVSGNVFEITQATTNGYQIITSTKSLNNNAPTIGIGIIYHPTKRGFPLITLNTPESVLTNALNTATISIDNNLTFHASGSSLPSSSGVLGDVVLNIGDDELYKLTSSGWVVIDKNNLPIEYANPITTAEPGQKGDIVTSYWDWEQYVFDGSSWKSPTKISSLPESAKFGDIFYVTTEKKLYMMDDEGSWNNISSSSISGGTENPLPKGQIYIGDENNVAAPVFMSGDATIAEDGDLTIGSQVINNDKLDKINIPLSGFGPAGASVSLGDGTNNFNIINLADPIANQDAATKAYVDSKMAATPSGDTFPTDSKVGDVFYNTADHTLYVFDGTDWSAIGSGGEAIIDLPKDMFYIGDIDNKAAPIAKIDIPLSGFGNAQDTLIMDNHRITKLANPVYPEDAATKAYVDNKTTNAGNTLPAAPKPGDTFFNTDDNRLYFYNGTEWVSLDNTLLHDQFYIGDAKNKAISIEKGLIPISGFGAAIADISLGNGTTNYKIINLGTPIDESDAVPKGYVDNILDGVTNGYMERAIYDSNQDSIVDVAATVNGFTVESNVPESAVFTDALVKVGPDGTPLYLSENDFEMNANSSEVVLKKLDFSKFAPIADNTLLGNNLGGDAGPIALTASEVKIILELDKVENTADEDKHVFSAGRIYPPIKINGEEFDGSSDINLGDDLGNHTATENIRTGAFSISNDGESGKGLSFDVVGNAIYAQDLTVNGNFYTPSDQRLKTNIETLTAALESLDQLRGIRFEYLDQKKYMTGPKVGLIAQELQKVYPEMVSQGADGFLKVDYTQLSAVLIQAVKEQQQQLRAQAQEIEDLKKRMDKQEYQLNNILQKLTE